VKKIRFPVSWVIVLVTIPLLAILARNQFNWLQEVRHREKERVQYSMINSAQALSKRLSDEILFLPSLLRVRDRSAQELDAVFAERYAFWRYYAISPSMYGEIRLYDEAHNRAMVWNGVHFSETGESMELRQRDFDEGAEVLMPIFIGQDFHATIACSLNMSEIFRAVIPTLASECLSSTDLYAYRIVDSRDGSVVFSTLDPKANESFLKPDIELPLIDDLSLSTYQSVPLIPGGDGLGGGTLSFIKRRSKTEPATIRMGISPGTFMPYRLQISNRDGSLEELSRKATVQNAIISIGIVGLLIVLIVSLAESTRRSNALALSQQEFIATITHELKTPLSVISSAAQNLSGGLVKDQKKAEQYGSMIRKEATRLGVSIEHFLLYANTGSLVRMKLHPCLVADLVDAALRFTETERTEAEFRTDVIMPDRPVFVLGDRIALESVFQNLAQNAVRHAREGKYLGISVIVSDGNTRKNPGKFVVVKFRDRGPGIPAKERKSIFEPFVRGRRAVSGQIPGNGIGLNLARRIVRMHGGSIVLESKPGMGTAFTVTLPKYEGAPDGA